MKTKTCSCCSEELPITDFWEKKQNKDGYYGQCKSCCDKKRRAKQKKPWDIPGWDPVTCWVVLPLRENL